MPGRILLEGCQLMLAEGTGIATYGRNLAHALKVEGWNVDSLVDTDKPLIGNGSMCDAIALFDAVRPIPWSPFKRRLRRRLGAPFGIRAVKVPLDGVAAHLGDRFRGFDGVWAATDLDQSARHHFIRYGKPARLRVAQTPVLFHATHPMAVMVPGCPNLVTIHDLVPLKLPDTTRDSKRYVFDLLRHLCRTADHIVTVSEFSRRDIIQTFGVGEDRVTNTSQAVAPPAAAGWDADRVATLLENAFGLAPDGYFLFVGAIEPKKNLVRLIDAYAASGSRSPLIIVGGLGWQYERELEKIADERFLEYRIVKQTMTPRRRVRRLAYLPSNHLAALMRGARALLFPSLYEGFGLPVLEAMSLGTPVLTSSVASLPEIAGDAAVFVDPIDIDDMAHGIRALDQDGDLRAELKMRGLRRAALFSPETYQKRVAALYARVIG